MSARPTTKLVHEGDYVAEVAVELLESEESWAPYLSLEDAQRLDAVREALQAAGAVRQDIDAAVIVHIVEMLSYGQFTIGDFKPLDQFPPYDAVMEALADMMDRALRPEGGGNNEAGKTIFPQMTAAARAQLAQIKQAKGTKQTIRQGATNDNR